MLSGEKNFFFGIKFFALGALSSFIIQLAFTLTANPQNEDEKSSHLPLSYFLLEGKKTTLSYDGRTKTAHWVYEELTRDSVTGTSDRSHFNFSVDPDIPKIIQPDLSDYRNSGFDRGHLAPAADFKSDPEAMRESFYLSNISPQLPEFNRRYWKQFEKYTRDLTYNYEVVRVVTGPLYLPHDGENGKRYVTYEVIGKNDVAVPTHFFKVISAKKGNEKKQWAYILPNKEIDPNTKLESFETSIQAIEKKAGIIFPQ